MECMIFIQAKSPLFGLLEAEQAYRKRFNNTEPFAITVAGNKYYVITDPQHAAIFYRNTTTLSWDDFLNQALLAFGVNPANLKAVWAKPDHAWPENPSSKSLIPLTEELSKKQYSSGGKLDLLVEKLISDLVHYCAWSQVSDRLNLNRQTRSGRISLMKFCGQTLIDVTQMTLFDPVLFDIDSRMTNDMMTFTDDLWKLMAPSSFVDNRTVKKIQERYVQSFLAYLRLPKSSRSQESWLVSSVIDQHKAFNMPETDSAAMLVMIYWT